MPDDPLTTLAIQLAQTHEQVVAVRGIVERLAMQSGEVRSRLTSLEERLTRVEQTVDAIKDLLERGQNGH